MNDFLTNENQDSQDSFRLRLLEAIEKSRQFNGWFTDKMVRSSLHGISQWLSKDSLSAWVENYRKGIDLMKGKKVAIICAGNIPLVGFHDVLTVFISGHKAVIKLSSDDKWLIPAFIDTLVKLEPSFKEFFHFTDERLDTFDAVIATGSNNTSRYFEYYFRDKPHLIRKNRSSVAILTGNETSEELEGLASDIFLYYGLGCRNVSKVFLPEGFEMDRLFKSFMPYSWVMENNKYMNNYNYHKTLYLMNGDPLLDNEFIVLKESKELHAPVGVLYFEYFRELDEVTKYLRTQEEELQCIVGLEDSLGSTQKPGLEDYADNFNTLEFLVNIH